VPSHREESALELIRTAMARFEHEPIQVNGEASAQSEPAMVDSSSRR